MKKVLFGCFAFMLTTTLSAQFYRPSCTTLGITEPPRGIDTTTTDGRQLANNYVLWDNGHVIDIKFMGNSSKAIRDLVIKYAKEWEQHANIKFNFLPDNATTAVMRIKIGEGLGHNSYIGLDCIQVPHNQQTMNLDTLGFIDVDWYIAEMKKRGITPNMEDLRKMMKNEPVRWNIKEVRGTVLHEFGHALGLLHEQSYPGAIKWNRDTIYKFYKETQGWDEDQIDHNVLAVSSQFYTNGTSYDPKSIMHYSVEPWQTSNGYSLPPNYELSAGDKAIISTLYPKNQAVSSKEVPRVIANNLTDIEIVNDKERGGIVIYPSFDLKTNSKLGDVYVVAMLVDENLYYIKDNNDYYNWGGYVAVYPKLRLTTNANVKYNKGQKNLELFLPYSEIPVAEGKTLGIHLRIALRDVENDNWVYVFNQLADQSFTLTK